MTKCFKLLLAAALLLCFAESASAQGSLIKDIAWRYTTSGAFPAPGAVITVCTSTATGAPCSPKVSLFSDAALTLSVANPLPVCSVSPQTGCIDGLGNWSAYVLPGGYTYSASGAGLTAYGPVPIYASVIQGGPASFSSLTVSGTTTLNGSTQYGINLAYPAFSNTPPNASTAVRQFDQFCAPDTDGLRGCGWVLNKFSNTGSDLTNFFMQSPWNPGLNIYNAGLSAAISSISRAGNVVTVNTATQVSLRPTQTDIIIAGVTGCATSPNGHFFPATVITATQFTYAQTGGNETCTPSTGIASPPSRAQHFFVRNDTTNTPQQVWLWENDVLGDRTDQYGLIQMPFAGGTGNVGSFGRLVFSSNTCTTVGCGVNTAEQGSSTGNFTYYGLLRANSINSDAVGSVASFSLRNFASTRETFIHGAGSNANGTWDVVFNSARGLASNGFYRFLMDGSGGIWVNSSDSSAFIPADFLGGVKTGTTLVPETVNTVDVGTAALPYRSTFLGTAATNNFRLLPAATAAARTINIPEFLASSATLAYNPPPVAGTTDLGTTALPFGNLWLGTAATNNFKLQPAATAAARVISMPDPLGAVNMPYVIASGTSTLTSNATLAAVTSQAAITTTATNTLTTDAIEWSYASAPTAGDSLCHVSAYVTAGNVNFVRTNPTAASQNVSAIVINWRVIR